MLLDDLQPLSEPTLSTGALARIAASGSLPASLASAGPHRHQAVDGS